MAVKFDRVKLDNPIDYEITEERKKLENEVQQLFRYQLYYGKPHNEVAAALSKAGIEPFDPEQIQKYMSRKAFWYARRLNLKRTIWMTLAWLSFGTFFGNMFVNLDAKNHISIAATIACISLVMGFVAGLIASNTRKYKAEWRRYGLCSYEHPIPTFVLERAIQAKKAYYNATIEISQLEANEVVRDPDPFLVVNGSYYIEVWDERDFEKKL